MSCQRLSTVAVHAGREDLTRLKVHAPPIDLSTTYPLVDLETVDDELDAWARGEVRGSEPIYSRLHNPTVARFEQAVATLEHTESAVAFASGMAALSACLLAPAGSTSTGRLHCSPTEQRLRRNDDSHRCLAARYLSALGESGGCNP
jgi:O-acetylhomoserine/O-acetylserine sulfhydrylase-like pyridoxal-dependent enzyme